MNTDDRLLLAPPLAQFEGIVEHGDALGRTLGFPTVNIPIADKKHDGVWCGLVWLNQGEPARAAAISVGTRPTYYRHGTRLLEAHLLDFDGDLYGRRIRVGLHEMIRPQLRFESQDQLIEHINVDVQRVRAWSTEYDFEGR